MKDRILKIDSSELLFYIVAIDILFLPYIRFLHVSISMIILAFWYVARFRDIKCDRVFCAIILFAFISIISIIYGNVVNPGNEKANLNNLITLLFCMLYYYFFLYHTKKREYKVENLFWGIMVFSAIMALLYRMSPQTYFNIRSYWTMSGTTIIFRNAFYNRYTFIQSDPNSIGPILCSMMLFILITRSNIEGWKKIFVVLLTGLTVFVTISATAVLVYCGSIFLYLILKKWYKFKVKVSRNTMVIFWFILILSFIFLAYMPRYNLFQVNTIEYIRTRVGANILDGTMSGRTDIWKNILGSYDWLEYLIIGKGVLVSRFGNIMQPHNGHFYMILSYGLSGYLLFLYLFFRKPKGASWKQYIPLIPMFLLFSVNTLVLDYRAMLALSLISATYHSKNGIKIF